MRVMAITTEAGDQLPASGRRNGDLRLYGKCRFDVEAPRMIERRPFGGETYEIPVQEAPGKTKRIRD